MIKERGGEIEREGEKTSIIIAFDKRSSALWICASRGELRIMCRKIWDGGRGGVGGIHVVVWFRRICDVTAMSLRATCCSKWTI